MDVDGTLTDGKIYMGNNGEEMKAFSIKDGYGIHDILIPTGIIPIIITGRKSKILENRCCELGIDHIYQGIGKKIDVLKSITSDYSSIAYIGDDLNDYECMEFLKKSGGLVGCPNDAVRKIIDISDYKCKNDAGNGAVREFIEWILELEVHNKISFKGIL